jgi:hypothetical protein
LNPRCSCRECEKYDHRCPVVLCRVFLPGASLRTCIDVVASQWTSVVFDDGTPGTSGSPGGVPNADLTFPMKRVSAYPHSWDYGAVMADYGRGAGIELIEKPGGVEVVYELTALSCLGAEPANEHCVRANRSMVDSMVGSMFCGRVYQ